MQVTDDRKKTNCVTQLLQLNQFDTNHTILKSSSRESKLIRWDYCINKKSGMYKINIDIAQTKNIYTITRQMSILK